jgi:hypothetical protein
MQTRAPALPPGASFGFPHGPRPARPLPREDPTLLRSWTNGRNLCGFRRKPITDSDSKCAVIPIESDPRADPSAFRLPPAWCAHPSRLPAGAGPFQVESSAAGRPPGAHYHSPDNQRHRCFVDLHRADSKQGAAPEGAAPRSQIILKGSQPRQAHSPLSTVIRAPDTRNEYRGHTRLAGVGIADPAAGSGGSTPSAGTGCWLSVSCRPVSSL